MLVVEPAAYPCWECAARKHRRRVPGPWLLSRSLAGGEVQYSAAGTVRWQQQQEESSARYQQPVLMIEGVQLSEDDDVSAGSQQCQVRSGQHQMMARDPESRVTTRGLSKVQYSAGNNDQRCYTVKRVK